MIVINTSPKFRKALKKAPQEIRDKTQVRFKMFFDNPFHPLLRTHKLHGDYEGYFSINITGDWRAIYKEIDYDTYLFVALGTHSELYS
jgi:addiction module RelE/StbE family toxin